MKNLNSLNLENLNNEDLSLINGGDGFWEGVGYVAGYVGGLAVRFAEGVTNGTETVEEHLCPC
ncbi:hypothetical protein [Salegentibacter mishustinae]|uniref:hypothetical protein n=1 Tax=Salegentibacter mishustinae TaxID=270918 RepID=UPI002492BA31|nr:hypothetical protein [Salegentibacter mishustinae]